MSVFSGRLSRKNFGLSFLLVLGFFVLGMLIIVVLLSMARAQQLIAQQQLQVNEQQINQVLQQDGAGQLPN